MKRKVDVESGVGVLWGERDCASAKRKITKYEKKTLERKREVAEKMQRRSFLTLELCGVSFFVLHFSFLCFFLFSSRGRDTVQMDQRLD